jgi:hypothetical protein
MRTLATAMLAALVLPGCAAYHAVQPLNGPERVQTELLVPLIAGFRVCVSAEGADAAAVEFANRSLHAIGVDAESRLPSGRDDVGLFLGPVTSLRDEAGLAWLLSLGLIPSTESRRDDYPCRIAGPSGREIAGTCPVEGPSTVYGWMGLIRGMTRGWQVISATGSDPARDAGSAPAQEARFGLCLARLLAGAVPAPAGR